MEFTMLDIFINSPYVLGLALYAISFIHRFTTSWLISIVGLMALVIAAGLYTYFVNKKAFTAWFKIRTIITQFLIIFGLEELLYGRITQIIRSPELSGDPGMLAIIILATALGCGLLWYGLITLGNKLGLLALKKNK